MAKISFSRKFFSIVNSLALVFQLVAPLVTLSIKPALATSPLTSTFSWDASAKKFHFSVNTDQTVDYTIAYQTNVQTEDVTGSAADSSGTFSRDIYAGTCSTGGTCVPHQVLRGILKTQVKSGNWIYTKIFTIDSGNLNVVKEGNDSQYNLTNEETTWLGSPTAENLAKINLTSSDSIPAPPAATASALIATPSGSTTTATDSGNNTNALTPQSPAAVAGTQTENQEHGSLSATILKNTSAPSLAPSLDLSSPTVAGSATLTTNKPDYSPTETAIITGSGFTPNKTYTLEISSSDPPPVNFSTQVTTNSVGGFTYAYQLDGNYRPNYKVEIKDASGNIVAMAAFTDACGSLCTNSATLNGAGSVSVAPEATITVAANVTVNGVDWHGTQWLISATPPGTLSCSDNPDHNKDGTYTDTLDGPVTAPSAPGTYNVYLIANSKNDCSGTAGSLLTMTNVVTVLSLPDLTAVKSNDVNGTVNKNAPFNWTVTVTNSGNASATFTTGQTILTDNLPSSNATYGSPSAVNGGGTTGTISCSITSNNLSCTASGGSVVIPVNGTIGVTIPVTAGNSTGTLTNPRGGGGNKCQVDPSTLITENDETNNNCSDSVSVVNRPDLTATKTNDVSGNATNGVLFHWTITVTNTGTATANFGNNKNVLIDDLPDTSPIPTYGTPTYAFSGGASGSSATCSISGNTLTCTSHNPNTVSIPAGSTLAVSIPVTPTGTGTLANPRSTGTCAVDPNDNISESNEVNNSCLNSVTVVAADITPPAGGSITYTDGYYTSASVALTVNDGTDSGSGINTASRIIKRNSATLTNGTCGAFGSFTTIAPSGSYPSFTDTSVVSGNCYQYEYLVSDNSSNQTIYTTTNTAKIDSIAPTISAVNTAHSDGSFKAGEIIDLTISYSETVNVTGTPTLALNSGGSANYLSGPGTSSLTFRYTVSAGENSSDLTYTSASALSLPGGATIKDVAGNDANNTLPDPSGFQGTHVIVIDTVAPTPQITSGPSGLVNSSSATFTFTADETATFGCNLDDAGFEICASGTTSGSKTYTGLGQGPHLFKLEAFDVAGNQDLYKNASRSWTVDTVVPTLYLPADITQEATDPSGAVVTYTATADDVDPTHPTVTCTPSSGSTFAIATTPVNCSATDTAGNTATGSFHITVQDTNVPAVSISGAPGSWVNTDQTATVTCNDAGSGCVVDTTTYRTKTYPTDPGTCSTNFADYLGPNPYTVVSHFWLCGTAKDIVGNAGFSAPVEFKVDKNAPATNDDYGAKDATWQNISQSITLTAGDSGGSNLAWTKYCVVTFASSPCTVGDGSTTYTTPVSFSDGDWYFGYASKDNAGNLETQKSRRVEVDTVPPTITITNPDTSPAQSKTITASGGDGTLTQSITTGSICDASLTFSVYSSTTFTLESDNGKKVCYKSVDTAGNTTYSLSNAIAGIDTTAPTIDAVTPIVAEATNASGATVTITPPMSHDAVDGDLASSCDQSTGTFPIGVTTVTCSKTDAAGNIATPSIFTVTVQDTTPPTLSLPFDITDEATGPGGAVESYTATAADLVDGPVGISCLPASGSTFSLGITAVNCSSTDAHSNTASSSFNVTIKDTTSPITSITSPTAGKILKGTVTVTADASDAVGVTKVEFYHSSPAVIKIGEVLTAPYSIAWDTTSVSDGNHSLWTVAYDNAANSSSSAQIKVVVDNTAPATPSATPSAGDYSSDQSVTLSSSDATSGLDKIYYTADGSDPDNSKTEYSAAITVDHDMTIKAIAYDNAGNSSGVLTATYGIPPIISAEASSAVGTITTTITWTTDDPSTSRVIYDTVSHPELGLAPNYGYAFSTVETDSAPKTTSHSVGLSGLTMGATYYYRTVSHGSPEAVGSEESFTTGSVAGTTASNGGGGGGNPSAPTCNDTKPGSAPTLTSALSGVNAVTLFWTVASDPVTYYLVTYGTSSGAQTYGNPNVGGRGTTSYTVTGLSGGATYYFKVRAGNGCMPGDYSNEISAAPTGGFIVGPAAGFAPGVLGAQENLSSGAATQSGVLGTQSAEVREIAGNKPPAGNWWDSAWWAILIILLGLGGAILFLRRHFGPGS